MQRDAGPASGEPCQWIAFLVEDAGRAAGPDDGDVRVLDVPVVVSLKKAVVRGEGDGDGAELVYLEGWPGDGDVDDMVRVVLPIAGILRFEGEGLGAAG